MTTTRRKFIVSSGIAIAGLAAARGLWARKTGTVIGLSGKIRLSFEPYNLALKHAFTLSGSSRTTTPVMLTRLDYEGISGYGEASMPPYLGESQESAAKFLSKIDLSGFSDPFRMEDILDYIDAIAAGNGAAKAAVDIALHDLVGKLAGQPWYRIWGLNPGKTPNTSFTIGIDSADMVRQKVAEASAFKILKVKLGRDNDREMIETVRSATPVPIAVDVNQGWKEKEKALDMIHWLKGMGVVLIEQPLPKERVGDMAWLRERSPLPVFGDEAVQRLPDIVKAAGVYHGVNIKLMKCTGMREAFVMAKTARALGMKVMIGCMTETSCAVSAAAQLSPLADYADLDGNLLIANDVFQGMEIKNGKITLNDFPGIGVRKI
ncbi:MAG: dipeptide epimerase [Candidatus Aminicenantes bacterium]|nr:dipeptide epimerase [Candidatus Aminicenantes bacterium]